LPHTAPCEHRRRHRPGLPSRLDADAELRAFIEARLDRLTFHAIAAEVAAAFPPGRRIGHSAIHDWWQRQQGRPRQRRRHQRRRPPAPAQPE
jgi:hypothetical protein